MNDELTTVSNGGMGEIQRAEIDCQIATAKRYPRQLSVVKRDMLSFATLDEDTAASCFYTLPRSGKSIQGPSIRLAEIALSCYGNIRAGSRVISMDTSGDHPYIEIQAVCHDLEKNVSVTIPKRRRITKKKSKDSIDEDDINLAANAGAAIALRDAIFKVIPLALVKPVFEAAKKVAIGDASTLRDRRAKCIETFSKMGVTQAMILAKLELPNVDDIGLSHLETLLGLHNAIKDGEASIDEAFAPPVKEDDNVPMGNEPAPKASVKPVDAKAEVVKTPQQELAEIITSHGFTFDDYLKWGFNTGNIEKTDDLTSFDDLPNAVAKRHVKARTGLLIGLKAVKGEA